jgi:hypothetical protein
MTTRSRAEEEGGGKVERQRKEEGRIGARPEDGDVEAGGHTRGRRWDGNHGRGWGRSRNSPPDFMCAAALFSLSLSPPFSSLSPPFPSLERMHSLGGRYTCAALLFPTHAAPPFPTGTQCAALSPTRTHFPCAWRPPQWIRHLGDTFCPKATSYVSGLRRARRLDSKTAWTPWRRLKNYGYYNIRHMWCPSSDLTKFVNIILKKLFDLV